MSLSETLQKILFGNVAFISKKDGHYDIISYEEAQNWYRFTNPYSTNGNHFTINKYGEILSGRHHKVVENIHGIHTGTITIIPYENDFQFSEYLNTVELDSTLIEEYSRTLEEMKDGDKDSIYFNLHM